LHNRELEVLIKRNETTPNEPSVFKFQKILKRERDEEEMERNERAFELCFQQEGVDEFGHVFKMPKHSYEEFEDVFKEIMKKTYTFSAKYSKENFLNQVRNMCVFKKS
jgi:hypothetical protein